MLNIHNFYSLAFEYYTTTKELKKNDVHELKKNKEKNSCYVVLWHLKTRPYFISWKGF